jgi:hypothetical protein
MTEPNDDRIAPATPPPPPAPRAWRALAVPALAVGVLLGFFLGRFSLEASWSSPLVTISPDQARASSSAGADPTPSAGSRVLRPMPLARTRQALAAMTASDPVKIELGSLGRSDGMSVTLRLSNHGACVATAVRGVVYGFDAWNQPSRLNLGGEHYVAFQLDQLSLAPGDHAQPEFPLKHPETASLIAGHVDEVRCADGTTWRRSP